MQAIRDGEVVLYARWQLAIDDEHGENTKGRSRRRTCTTGSTR